MSDETSKKDTLINAINEMQEAGIIAAEVAEKAREQIEKGELAVTATQQETPVIEETPVVPPRIKKAKPKDAPVAPDLVDQFVTWFFITPESGLYDVKRGQYECRVGDKDKGIAHTLLFHSERMKNYYDKTTKSGTYKREDPEDANNVIGIRPVASNIGVFNASRIMYGTANKAQQRPQAAAEKAGAIPIPFQNVVSKSGGAGLDLSKLQIVDWKGSEKMVIPPISRLRDWTGTFHVIERHFTGAMVIRVEQAYFLFDADREEVKRFGFNPFFTQLPGPVATVEEAYEALMPEEVKTAIAAGKVVQRQGEFFFIPMSNEAVAKLICKDRKFDIFSILEISQQLAQVGAAYFNWLQAERWVDVSRFKSQCERHNNGYLPEGDAKINAAKLFDPYLEVLSKYVGTPIARGITENGSVIDKCKMDELANILANKKEDYRSSTRCYASSMGNTHLGGLAVQFEQIYRGVPDSTTREMKPSNAYLSYGIMMNVRIGETVEPTDWRARQRQHQATAVVCTDQKQWYAIGTVIHQGREHRPVYLDTWHKVVANTATNNWTVGL